MRRPWAGFLHKVTGATYHAETTPQAINPGLTLRLAVLNSSDVFVEKRVYRFCSVSNGSKKALQASYLRPRDASHNYREERSNAYDDPITHTLRKDGRDIRGGHAEVSCLAARFDSRIEKYRRARDIKDKEDVREEGTYGPT